MASIENSYTVELSLERDGNIFDSSTIAFIIQDSIYSYFPRATLTLNDIGSYLRDSLGTIGGIKYFLKYGFGSDYITNKFEVVDDSLAKINSYSFTEGQIEIGLIHELYNNQELSSNKFEDRISGIVRKVANKYPYNLVNINDTGNQSEWFQFMQRDSEFILNNLLPLAYSNNANNSPFYCFINSNNEFHFRNYSNMFNQQPVAQLILSDNVDTNIDYPNAIVVSEIKPFRESMTSYRELQQRYLVGTDENGNLKKGSDKISDYPSETAKLPIRSQLNDYTGVCGFPDEKESSGSKENAKGYYTNKMKKGMNLEKLLVTLPYNPLLRSGYTVDLLIPEKNGDIELSPITSGKYLIEKSQAVWSGMNGISVLVVGRKDTKVFNNNKIRGELLGN